MQEHIDNRKNLYDNLLNDGYFRGDNGEINFSFDDFNENLDDIENAKVLYENLLGDGYFQNEDGILQLSESEFLEMIGSVRSVQEFYPITENQRGVYIDWDMNRDTTQYNIADVLPLPGHTAERIKEAVTQVINAHPYIKTRLLIRNGDVMQQRRDTDLPEVSVEWLEFEPDVAFFQERVRPFDLLNDCLYRIEIYQTPSTVYLFTDFHHIVFDGGSSLVFAGDVHAVLNGGTVEPETYSSFDVALDEARMISSGACSEAEHYFEKMLSGSDTTVFPHSQIPDDTAVGNVGFWVHNKSLQSYCQRHAVTEGNFFLTMMMIALHKLTREEQVVVTSINNGRNSLDMMNLFGMFVKTLPVSLSVPENGKDVRISDFVKEINSQFNESVRHSIFPFTSMTERFGIRPEIMFAYQPAGKYYGEEQVQASESLALDTVKTPIAIDVLAYEGGHYQIILEYDGMLYSKNDMSALERVMGNITRYVLANDCTLGELPLLDGEEKDSILSLSRGEKMEVDFSKTFVSLFTEQVRKTPDATALVGGDGTYTYAELDSRTNAFARYLRGKGVSDGEFVCVELVASSNFMIAAIGIQKAGAAYVPVDPAYPEERRQYISEDSESRLTVTEAVLQEVDWCDDGPIDRTKPEGAAYMIYTSGSTGKPKGVVIPHRGLLNLIQFTVKEWSLTSECRMSVYDSVSFDASVEDLFSVLTIGGTLYPVPQEARRDLSMVHDFIIANNINSGNYTTQFGLLLAQAYPEMPLDYMNVGGEKMTANPSCSYRIINTYGPTEVTVNSTYFFLEPGREYRNIPIGRPLHNLSCYVMDEYGHLLPRGIAGELCISGPQVATGYWKREELTAEKFVDCPYDEGKMYHTGDLVRYNEDGDIEYLGRIDNQVKLRGFRIELGEIETQISGYEGIGVCSVQVREVGGVQHLCAYYSADREIDESALKEYLSTRLTDYMVPTAYMQLDEMPMTPNGKINTKALPQPEVKVEEMVAPETDTEKKLFDLAAEVLRHNQFGVTSNLISMGLTSLSAMRLGVMIQQSFGKAVPTRDIIQNPILRLISDIIDGRLSSGGTQIAKVHEIQTYYPLTENQRGVYIDWEMNRDALQYNIADVQVIENVDAAELCRALKVVVDAHPVLKTRLTIQDGDVMMQRCDDASASIVCQEIETEPDSAFFQKRVRPFDLFESLYRLEVYCLKGSGKPKVWLFSDFHHIVFDGGSSYVFFNDLQRALGGENVEMETYTAFDRALDEQEMQQSERFTQAELYFDRLLSCYEVASYPHSAVPDTTVSGLGHRTFHVDGEMIHGVCRKYAVTENSYFMTMVTQVLHRILREDSLLFTSISNGRSTAEMEDIIGMFVQTLPVVTTSADGCAIDAVKEVQKQFADTQFHSIYPYTRLVEKHKVHPEIMYVHQGFGGLNVSDGISDKEQSDSLELDTAKMPILISTYPDGDNYVIDIEYDTSLYNIDDMSLLGSCIKHMAETIALSPECSLSSVSIADDEAIALVNSYSSTPRLDFSLDDNLVDLIHRQALAAPDATAVVFRDRKLSYAELDAITDKLAVHLHNEGVGIETVVGVMIERSELMVVYPLAIMKAGGAYMPLDPHFPEDRLMFMCNDAGVRLILSDTGLVNQAIPSFEGSVFESSQMELLPDCTAEEVKELPVAAPDNMFVILYTSGSTGKPKGCMLEHHNIVNFCHWYVSEFNVTADDRSVAYANFGFDAHMMDIYPALTVGASVYVIPSDMRMDLVELNRYMDDNHLTITFLTTQIGYLFATTLDNHSLRLMSVGGESLPRVKKPRYRFYNGYGPTECTLFSTFYNIEDEFTRSFIGKPLAGYSLMVVDKWLQPVPESIAGELIVMGHGVGRGYLNRDDLNAEKFITINGERAYRTGDLVCWTDGGVIEFLGRIDNQVKLRGLRIELGEIENCVAAYEDIQQVCVDVKDINHTQHLCCYYTTQSHTDTVDVTVLKAFLAEHLAEFMVPDVYVYLDDMPLTPNGKINKRVLPTPDIKSEVQYVEPANDTERIIARYFAKVLGTEDSVGALDSFYAIGGDSIKAIRLVSMLRTEGISLQISQVMKLKTVRALAAAAEEASSALAISQESWSGVVGHSAITDFFFNLQLPDVNHFLQTTVIQSREPLDMNALHMAFDAIVRHHDMLRAVVVNGEMTVREADADNLYNLEEFDLKELSDRRKIQQQILKLGRGLRKSFDIYNNGMMRIAVYHLSDTDVIDIALHHLVVDGVSWRILLEDIQNAYVSYRDGGKPQLPAKTHSYQDYCKALDGFRMRTAGMRELAYWMPVRNRLRNLPCSVGNDYCRVFAQRTVELDAESTSLLLQGAARAYNAEINDLLIAALARAYTRIAEVPEFTIQMEGHGRENFDDNLVIDRTVGWFTSIYPVIVGGLNGDIRHDIRCVKEILHNVPNKGFGYGPLLNIDVDATPLIGFNYLGEMDAEQANADSLFVAADYDCGADMAEEDAFGPSLSLNGSVSGGKLAFSLAFDRALYTDEFAQSLARAFVDEMKSLAAHCHSVEEPEHTASDLGESQWNDDEFWTVWNDFAARGIALERIYPLTPMQESMVLTYLSNPDAETYRIQISVRVNIAPNEEQMREVLRQLGIHHEVLRTSVILNNVSVYRQAIVTRELGLSMHDLTDIPEDRQLNAFKELLDAERIGKFDLQFSPLFGVIVAKTSEHGCFMALSFHHLIVDGWCVGLITSSILAALRNVMGMADAKPLTCSTSGLYEQYVRGLSDRNHEDAMNYWHELLKGYGTKAVIPYDKDIVEPTDVFEDSIDIDSNVVADMMELCREEGISPNTVVELAWGLTLQAYNNTDDAVFAKVVSGRDNADMDVSEVVGLFINSVPVRIHTDAGMTVRECLRMVHQQASATNSYDYCAMTDIMQQSELGSNLFQSIIGFQNFPAEEESRLCDIQFEPLVDAESNVNDISMQASIDDRNLHINIRFDNTLYSRRSITRTLNLVATLIKGIATRPDCKCSELPLIVEGEMEQILNISYGGKTDYDHNETYIDMIMKHVAEQPESLALVDDNGSMTYAQMNDASEHLAAFLISNGVAKGDFVAIQMGRQKEFIVAVIAVNRIGAAYVPVDPDYPADRREFMISDSAARFVITSDTFALAERQSADNQYQITDNADPADTAYMIYTSGTSGRPKGVMISHASIRSCASWLIPAFDLKPGKRNMHHPSFSFDASTFDLFYPLAAGATVHVLGDNVRKDLEGMYRYICDNAITGMTMSTALGMELLNAYNLPVEYIMLGGEKFLPVKHTDARLFNGYGPTEFTCCSSYHVINQDTDTDIPIGRAVPGSWSFVCDRHGRLLPYGMAGELCLCGTQISCGYWGREDLTKEKFTDTAMLGLAGDTALPDKMYRTGDMARYNRDGELMFLGRIDNQVKLRGFRIELGEIEQQAKSFHDIDKVVADIRGTDNVRFICLYYTVVDDAVVPGNDSEFIQQLKEHLMKHLADYMVPTAYVHLDKMPITPGGKVDHKALPEPAVVKTIRMEPQSHGEQILFDIVSRVLGNSAFGVTDDLRYLGMSSILAIRTVAMANEKGLFLKLEDLLKAHSIREVLSLQSNICSWYSVPSPERPAVVLVQGETDFAHLQPYIEALDRQFSVLVIESIRAHYEYVFPDCDGKEALELYYSLIEMKIEEAEMRVAAFTGHCFGSDLAYRLACRWTEEHSDEHISMLMLESFWVDQNRSVERISEDSVPDGLKTFFADKSGEIDYYDQMYKNLDFCGSPQYFNGRIALFRATRFEHHLDSIALLLNMTEEEVTDRFHIDDEWIMRAWQPERTFDNEQLWRSFRPDIECFNVDSDHVGILDEQFVQQYVDWITKNCGI